MPERSQTSRSREIFRESHVFTSSRRASIAFARALLPSVRSACSIRSPATWRTISTSLLFHGEQLNVALWFAYSRGQFFLRLNHLTRMPVRELERFCKFSFRHFLCRAFDHDHVVFIADINEIEIALGALVMCRVGNELTVNATNAHRADRACKRNVRNSSVRRMRHSSRECRDRSVHPR